MKKFFITLFSVIIITFFIALFSNWKQDVYISSHEYERGKFSRKGQCYLRDHANGNIKHPIYYRDPQCQMR